MPGDPDAPFVAAVVSCLKAWNPDFIVTAGDNNHDGAADFDVNVGQHFHEYIGNYSGTFGEGSTTNRFFPALGNHDYSAGLAAYRDFFTLPGNERYYDFAAGPVHFFVVNSNSQEPDGYTGTSVQAGWLQSALGQSTSPWNFVFLHHAPYTSSSRYYGGIASARWNFGSWGADAVFAGHAHVCERIVRDGLNYFVTGVAGETTSGFGTPIAGSEFRYGNDHAFMVVDVDGAAAVFRFVNMAGDVVGTYTMPVPANEWASPSGGSFNVAANWTRGHWPSAPDAVANILRAVSGPVSVDVPVVLGAINLNSPGGVTLTGPAGIRFETTGSDALIQAAGGDFRVSVPFQFAAHTAIAVADGMLVLSGAIDNSAGLTLTKTGDGTLVIEGVQDHGQGALFRILGGTVLLESDAGADSANLSVTVSGAVLQFGCDQHLDTLAVGDGGRVILTGPSVIVVNHLVIGGVDLGPATITPEPATLAMVFAGAAATLLCRRPGQTCHGARRGRSSHRDASASPMISSFTGSHFMGRRSQ